MPQSWKWKCNMQKNSYLWQQLGDRALRQVQRKRPVVGGDQRLDHRVLQRRRWQHQNRQLFVHRGERLLDCLTSKPDVKLPSLDVPAGPGSKPTELPPNLHIVDGMAYQVAAAAEVSQVDLIVMQACKLEQTNDSPTPAPKKLENVLVLLEIVSGDVVVVRLADFQRGIDQSSAESGATTDTDTPASIPFRRNWHI